MAHQTPPLVIACASDEAYVRHAAVMMLSAVRSSPQRGIQFHYLHEPDGVSEGSKEQLRKMLKPQVDRVDIQFHSVPQNWLEGLPVTERMPAVMWYRLFLPRLLPDVERALYLDSDTVVLDDLGALWDMNLAGMALAAVTQPFPEKYLHWPEYLGLLSRESYFNSGVLLMDLERFRRDGLSERVLQHGRTHAGRTHWIDQDSLCAELHACRLPLHPRWNLLRATIVHPQAREVFSKAERLAAIRNPGIAHFEGHAKPWQRPDLHPYSQRYITLAAETPWGMPSVSWGLSSEIKAFLEQRQWLRLYTLFLKLQGKVRRMRQRPAP